MVKTVRILSLVALVLGLVTFSNCGPDPTPAPPAEDVQLDMLAKTWKITSVTRDGIALDLNEPDGYAGFQLSLSGTKGSPPFSYTTTGRPSLSPWKAGGTWEFGTDIVSNVKDMIRDKGTADELPMEYTVTESTLTISFNFQGAGYTARTGVVKGNWVYTFGL